MPKVKGFRVLPGADMGMNDGPAMFVNAPKASSSMGSPGKAPAKAMESDPKPKGIRGRLPNGLNKKKIGKY